MDLAPDTGSPLHARPAGAGPGLVIHTGVCPSLQCPRLHLRAVEAGSADDEAAPLPGEGLTFSVDIETGRLAAGDEPSEVWLTSEHGAWLAPWVAEHAAVLRSRFDRLKAQSAGAPADTRPAPAWTPGARVHHRDLYPHDFLPTVQHAGKRWAIDVACCPDPACPCAEVALGFSAPGGDATEVVGVLGARPPKETSALGKALWKAVHDAPEIVERLEERRDEIRYAGPFIVGVAYEKARLARHTSTPLTGALSQGGYLEGGAIPEALVRRLFDTSARLHAVRSAIEAAWWGWILVEARGAIHRDGWAHVTADPISVALFDAPGNELPRLELTLGPRHEASLAMRQQRCALGLPLLGGVSLPIVDSWGPEGTPAPRSADDVRFAVALVEALLAAPHDEVMAVSGAPRVFEHRVELDAGPLDVRLTASASEHPWTAEDSAAEPAPLDDELDDELGDDDLGDDDLDDDDLDDDELDDDDLDDDLDVDTFPAAPLVEGFTDAALDRGLAPEVVSTARVLLDALGSFAAEEPAGFFDERTWAAFLSDHAPRKVMLEEGDIARAPAALHAVVDWLGEVGHVDPRRLRASLDRVLLRFQQRARDPRRFGMAKALLTEARDADVDCGDQAALDRFLAKKNALAALRPAPNAAAPPAPAAGATPAKTVTRSPTRWSPAPGERWPAPTDPCGCGSGKRFKKCCMVR